MRDDKTPLRGFAELANDPSFEVTADKTIEFKRALCGQCATPTTFRVVVYRTSLEMGAYMTCDRCRRTAVFEVDRPAVRELCAMWGGDMRSYVAECVFAEIQAQLRAR